MAGSRTPPRILKDKLPCVARHLRWYVIWFGFIDTRRESKNANIVLYQCMFTLNVSTPRQPQTPLILAPVSSMKLALPSQD